jgi:ERI1 exoribonuclease 3
MSGFSLSLDDVKLIVAEDSKTRFHLRQTVDRGWEIRANQGHSKGMINTSSLLTKITDPTQYPNVIHGTYFAAWSFIASSGLNRMKREHIHFAPGFPENNAVMSGMRGNCEVAIFIDLPKAIQDGYEFFVSRNKVILTEGKNGVLPPQYFAKVLNMSTGEELKWNSTAPQLDHKQRDCKLFNGQKFDYICVLDFEATCDRGSWPTQEIIEFPVVPIDTKTLSVHEEIFHRYVRPVSCPQLTPFCTELTGIQQATVDQAEPFLAVFSAFDQYLSCLTENRAKSVCFVTCGDWDLKTMLPKQCRALGLPVPSYFTKWINIKHVYQKTFRKKAGGMMGMLQDLGITHTGRHHSGIDDVKNIANIVIHLIQAHQVEFDITFDTAVAGQQRGHRGGHGHGGGHRGSRHGSGARPITRPPRGGGHRVQHPY